MQDAHMNRLILLSASLLFGGLCWGQSLSPTVISSGGGYQQGARASLSYTIGEVATQTYRGERVILTQGFEQSGLIITSLADLLPELQLQLFPNPTASWLSVLLPEGGNGLSFLLVDGRGRILRELSSAAPGSTARVDLTAYPAGIYFLRALTTDRTAVKTFRLVKTR